MEIDNVNENMDRESITISGKCDWCNERSAIITDGRYVYCSNNCKKEFINDALRVMKELDENR